MNRLLAMILLGLTFVLAAHAQTSNTVRLSTLASSGDKTLRLEGTSAQYDIPIPLASRALVTSATLDLRLVSSMALVEERSFLSIRFNDATIAQIPFSPRKPSALSSVAIPAELWRVGNNTLTLAVSQHYAQQCEESDAPELWSEVDLYRSKLNFTAKPSFGALTLRDLSHFFSPGLGSQDAVTLVTPSQDATIQSEALPRVAQALALRAAPQPLKVHYLAMPTVPELPALPGGRAWTPSAQQAFSQSRWYFPKGDDGQGSLHVLVANKSQLVGYLSDDVLDQIVGPYLHIERTAEVRVDDRVIVPEGVRLIVSGRSPDEVSEAALALGTMDDLLNPVASLLIKDTTSPTARLPAAPQLLKSNREYTFRELGTSGMVFKGEKTANKRLSFKLPGDAYVPDNASMQLYLNFGYGAGAGPGSIMNVLINGELVHGLSFSNPNGQVFQNYSVVVPARHLKGGANHIDFEITQRAPLNDVGCGSIGGNHLRFHLQGSSRMRLPEVGHVTQQPNLAIFAETSYPFAPVASDNDTAIYLTSEAMRSAGLTLSGKMAQVAGGVLPNVRLYNQIPNMPERNRFLLATPATLGEQYREAFYDVSATSWLYRTNNELQNRIARETEDNELSPPKTQQITYPTSTLGDLGILMATKSEAPSNTGSTFLLVAETPAKLESRIADLISPAIWGQLAGDFFVWRNNERPELALQVADVVHNVGEPQDNWFKVRMWLSTHPWYWSVGLLIVILVCSLVASIVLRRRNQQVREEW